METKKLQDLAESTAPNDTDIFILEDATATKKVTFLNLFNKIKTKLGLKAIATSGKAADLTYDANNRAVTDVEKKKWNGYESTISALNSDLGELRKAKVIWESAAGVKNGGVIALPENVANYDRFFVNIDSSAIWFPVTVMSGSSAFRGGYSFALSESVVRSYGIDGTISGNKITLKYSTRANIAESGITIATNQLITAIRATK